MFQFCIWIIIVLKWTGPWHFVMSLSNIWNYFRESVNTISTYNLNNFSHSLHTNLKYNRIVLLMLCNEISNKGERQSKLFPKFQDFRDLGLMNIVIFNLYENWTNNHCSMNLSADIITFLQSPLLPLSFIRHSSRLSQCTYLLATQTPCAAT